MSIKPFGTHLILDADCCEGNITDKNHIQEFINQLVAKLGMKKKGDTQFIILKIIIIIESVILSGIQSFNV